MRHHALPRFLSLALARALLLTPGAAQDARLVNLSTRAMSGTGAEVLTSGFVVPPGGNATVLIRAIGPTLGSFGLTGALADPTLTLLNAAGATIAANDNWNASDAATMAAVGAFALPGGSRDAALVATLPPGSYTAQVTPATGTGTGAGGTSGLALVEIYEVGTNGVRLLNLSTRAQVAAGATAVIPGLVIRGSGERRLLIRAAGPALASFGLTGALGDPTLTVTNAAGTILASNDNWGTPVAGGTDASALAGAFAATGAFAFASGSRDAAVLTTLGAGAYTVQVSASPASASSSGLVLVELYDLTPATATSPTATTSSPTTPATTEPIATAGNGDKLPHPLAFSTYTVTDGARTIAVPETMVYVPAGAFTYGTGSTASTPAIDAFCIGKFEVTNAEWKAFLDATGSKTYPAHWSNGTYPNGKAAHPVLYVSLTSAQAYCAWISQKTGWQVSIPTAQQWEKAARGPNAYLYPWGNSLDSSYNAATGVLTTKCNYNAVVASYYLFNYPNQAVTYSNRNSPYYGRTTTVGKIAAYETNGTATLFSVSASGGVNAWVNHDTWTGFIYTDLFDSLNAVGGTTTPVGSYASGKSAYGCHDMAGNAWEWTTTTITATNGAEAGQAVYSVRGGSWYATSNSMRAVDIGEGRAASGNFNTVGFRIVAAPKAP